MLRAALCAVTALALVAGCEKKKSDSPKEKPAATLSTGTVANGVRTVAIEAGKDGYVPERIPGKPGEQLKLVFTRTVDADCLSQLKTPDGKTVPLPLNKPVEIAVTVPTDGQVKFACGMDMFEGFIVADKG